MIYLVALAPCLIIWTAAKYGILSPSTEWRKLSRGLSVAYVVVVPRCRSLIAVAHSFPRP